MNLTPAAGSRPTIASGGIVSAASYQAGVSPGSWISIFGQNLAASTRAVAVSDLVTGNLPTTLGGVSASINSKAAFLQYISPAQINVQAPADDTAGSAQVTVTNSATSDAGVVTIQPILPAFFASSNYVAAVRGDGTIITSSVPAKSGEVLQLYATGLGPANPAVAPGLVFEGGSNPTTNAVTVTIGGVNATVSFAGLVATGLYHINTTIPALGNGDHEVIARVAGLATQSGVLLRIQN